MLQMDCQNSLEMQIENPTLWDPMDCSLPHSSVHGILQARVLDTTLWLNNNNNSVFILLPRKQGLQKHIYALRTCRLVFSPKYSSLLPSHGSNSTSSWGSKSIVMINFSCACCFIGKRCPEKTGSIYSFRFKVPLVCPLNETLPL